MKDYAESITLNFYSFDLPERWMERLHELTGLPIMMTEFSFCAGAESGFLHNTNGARNVLVRTQARRGETYRAFVERRRIAALHGRCPLVRHVRLWEPNGLIGNYGLLDLADEPMSEFAASVQQTNESVLRVRQGVVR